MDDYIEILINNKPIRITKKDAKINDIDTIHFNITRPAPKYGVVLFDTEKETWYYSVKHNCIVTTKTGFKSRGECRADMLLMEDYYKKLNSN